MQDQLKLGFFIQPVHPPSRPYAVVLREDREAVVLADRLGYCEAFIGEHLVDSAETITSSLAFIAHLADACPSITFGTGVLPVASYHPAMAAAQVAMVDHLVQGRLVLGVGPGVAGDAEAMGDLGSDRRRKSAECQCAGSQNATSSARNAMCRRCIQACTATSARMTICVQSRRFRVPASDPIVTIIKATSGQNTGSFGEGAAHSVISGGAPPQEFHSQRCMP